MPLHDETKEELLSRLIHVNKNPPGHLAEIWVLFKIYKLIVITYLGGPDTAGHPTESTDSPQLSKNKHFPDAYVLADTHVPGIRFLSSCCPYQLWQFHCIESTPARGSQSSFTASHTEKLRHRGGCLP